MMTADFGAAIRTALMNDVQISGLLDEWQGEPAIFTKRPVPSDATYPMILVSTNVGVLDQGGLVNERIAVVRDVLVYGDQPDQYRAVETVADLVRELFHRTRFSIAVSGYNITLITVTGPHPAPADDDKSVARVVTLTIQAQRA